MNNESALLAAIAICEGTPQIPGSDNGYNVLVGATQSHPMLFSSYADHPRILNRALNSTAAGRYQILAHIFDSYKDLLNLPDFSPASQDAIAIQMLRECRALSAIDQGYFDTAIARCCHLWASLPGSPWGQHTRSLQYAYDAYLTAGGTTA